MRRSKLAYTLRVRVDAPLWAGLAGRAPAVPRSEAARRAIRLYLAAIDIAAGRSADGSDLRREAGRSTERGWGLPS